MSSIRACVGFEHNSLCVSAMITDRSGGIISLYQYHSVPQIHGPLTAFYFRDRKTV